MEEKLIKNWQNQIGFFKDQNAYKCLFLHVFPHLQNFAFSILHSRQLAEEVTSDVLLNIWQLETKLLTIENLKVYLFISIKNNSIKLLEKEKLRNNFSIDNYKVEFLSDYCSPIEKLETEEFSIYLKNVIQNLPPKCQLVYKMAKEDKLKLKEISIILNISIKTIDNHLSKALYTINDAIYIYRNR